jgi:hypothetical protein
MKPDEARVTLGKMVQQSRYLCEVARTALHGRQSLNGDGSYARKLHNGAVTMSAILAKLEPTFRQITDDSATAACANIRAACTTLTSTAATATSRASALKSLEMSVHSCLDPFLEQLSTPSVPASEQVLPASVVAGTRGYLLNVLLQANGAYERGWFDAASVMIRKLVEILIIEVYEAKNRAAYIKHNEDPAADFLMLSDLIDRIMGDTAFNLARETKKTLPLLKALGDRSAHNRRYLAKKDDVDKVIPGLRVVADDLLHLAGLK